MSRFTVSESEIVCPESKCQNICLCMERRLDLRNTEFKDNNLSFVHELFSVRPPPQRRSTKGLRFPLVLDINASLLPHDFFVYLLHLCRAN